MKELEKQNYDIKDIDVKLFNAFSEQIFNTGFVHADPHPGNGMKIFVKHCVIIKTLFFLQYLFDVIRMVKLNWCYLIMAFMSTFHLTFVSLSVNFGRESFLKIMQR